MSGWIDASKKKPPEHSDPKLQVWVIVYVPELESEERGDGIYFGRYIPEIESWRIEGSPSDWGVTHWQLKPKKPTKK